MTTKINKPHTRTFRSKKLNQDHIKILNEAIRNNAKGKQKDVHLTYQKENGEVSERKVRPLAVKDKSLFVVHCHERNALRSFRVERIKMVKKAFWDGFEKKAISSKLLRRASEEAENKIRTSDRKSFFKNYAKWNRQPEKFRSAAKKKEMAGK